MILFLLSLALCHSISTAAQQGDNPDFEIFRTELITYRDSVAPFPILRLYGCEEYILVWSQDIQHSTGWHDGIRSNGGDLCHGLMTYVRTNRKTPRIRGGYGSWRYELDYIGDKYAVITGEAATGSVNMHILYYQRME